MISVYKHLKVGCKHERVELHNRVLKGFNLRKNFKREFKSKYNEAVSQRVCIYFLFFRDSAKNEEV